MENTLHAACLSIKRDKFQVYRPRGDPGYLAELFQVPVTRCASDGFVVCGHPLATQADGELCMECSHELPLGTHEFQAVCLVQKQHQYELKLPTLRTLNDNVDHGGLHVVLRIVRTSLQQTVVHLLRALPIAVTRSWSLALDELTTDFVAEVFHLQKTQITWSLIQYPISFGGLGFLSYHAEAPLHALSQCLSLRASREAEQREIATWTIKKQLA